VGRPVSFVDDEHAVVEVQDRGHCRMVDERAVGDAPATGAHGPHFPARGGPEEVEVVDVHIQDVRVAHRVPEVVRREERPRVAPAAYPDRNQLPEVTFHENPLHGAEWRVAAVVLADDKDAPRPVCGLDEAESVFEAGGEGLLTKDVLAGLQCGPRHGVVRPGR